MQQNITRALADTSRNIRVPVHVYEKLSSFKRTFTVLEQELNREPNLEEIAERMGISQSKAKVLYDAQFDSTSMNVLISDENETELGDFLPDPGEPPDMVVIRSVLQNQVKELLEKYLTPKEIDVLLLRNGSDGGHIKSLEEIGEKYGVTRERIRQIQNRALRKLILSRGIKEYAGYMEDPNKALDELYEKRRKFAPRKHQKKIEGNSNNMSKQIKTIYELFKEYTREQVDAVIAMLDDKERELIRKRYGDDLDNPSGEHLNKEDSYNFYGKLVYKMRKMLKENFDKKKLIGPMICPIKDNPIEESVDANTGSITDNIIEETDEKKLIGSIIKPIEGNPIEESVTDSEQLTTNNEQDADLVEVLKLFRTVPFKQLMSSLDPKKAIIIALKLGYIENENGRKYYSTEEIADFLGIDKSEVIETTKSILLLYKENIIRIMDTITDILTDMDSSKTLSFGSNSK